MTTIRGWIPLFLLFAVPGPVDGQLSPYQIVQTHLGLALTVDYDKGTVGGVAELRLKNVGPDIIDEIPLQIGRLMVVTDVKDSLGSSLTFVQDIVRFEDWPRLQVNQVHVEMPPLAPGAEVSISVDYEGFLVGYVETGMLYVRDHVSGAFTIIRSDARAFPQLGIPSLAAIKAASREDFTFRAELTVPDHLVIAAPVTGTRSASSGGSSTWVFQGADPVPFLNISIAPFGVMERQGVRIFYLPADSAGAAMVLSAVFAALGDYDHWFGPLDREPRLTVTEIPEGWGSQASLTGGIIQTADAFRDRAHMAQVYHEIAHLWHPRDVDQPPVRWNEGLASFLQQRVAAERDGAAPLDEHMHDYAARYAQRIEASGAGEIPMIEYGVRGLTDLSYRTGRLMFYVLFRVMGREQFDATLGGYFAKYRSAGGTTHDFVDYFLAEGPPEIRPIFTEWLQTTRWATQLTDGESLESIIASYN